VPVLWPGGQADDEELDLMDEALFLMRPDDEDRKVSRGGRGTACLGTFLCIPASANILATA
jgi:hypothetical protein